MGSNREKNGGVKSHDTLPLISLNMLSTNVILNFANDFVCKNC